MSWLTAYLGYFVNLNFVEALHNLKKYHTTHSKRMRCYTIFILTIFLKILINFSKCVLHSIFFIILSSSFVRQVSKSRTILFLLLSIIGECDIMCMCACRTQKTICSQYCMLMTACSECRIHLLQLNFLNK